MDENELLKSLWNDDLNQANYGDKYQSHLFQQYKLYVELADRVSARRNLANTFFVSLNTFLITVLGFVYNSLAPIRDRWIVFVPLAAALALTLTWWLLIRSYRQLNSGKYKVIGEYEKRLPTSPFWSAEWKILGEGKDLKRYLPLTHVENLIPLIFAILYVMFTLIAYYSL